MAPRRMKDKRPPSDLKDEPISETASSALGDDLALRKKRGRPRKSAHASAFADREGDDYFEDADFDEDAAASDEDDSYQDEQKGTMPTTIAKDGGISVNGGVEQKRESTRKGARRTPLQQSGKDGLDLHSELLMRCLQGRGSHRRKGKPTRAVQASF